MSLLIILCVLIACVCGDSMHDCKFSNRKLTKIPPPGQLAMCESLNLSNNNLILEPSDSILFPVRELYMENCNLEGLSYLLDNIASLVLICMSHNNLKELDLQSFQESRHLKEVNASHNNITVVVNNAEMNLTKVNLSYNLLSEIPMISAFEDVTHLDLSYNKIDRINESQLDYFKNLQFLDLRGNPLECYELPSHLSSIVLLSECRLPATERVITSTSPEPLDVNSSSNWIVPVVLAGAAAVFLVLVVFAWCKHKRRNNSANVVNGGDPNESEPLSVQRPIDLSSVSDIRPNNSTSVVNGGDANETCLSETPASQQQD